MRNILSLIRCKSGAAAVEFAIIAPVFLLMLLTLVAFGIYMSATNAIQQIASDAARTAIAGMNSAERETLARQFIQGSTLDYYMINPTKISISVVDDPKNANQFTVSVDYDASELPIWSLYSFAMPDHRIKRFSTIRIGGI